MSTELAVSRLALPDEPDDGIYRAFGRFATAVLAVATKADWRAAEKVPRTGGVLIVSNHISDFDPLALGHFLISAGRRWPRYIGKATLWRVPVIGYIAKGCGQIPVERNSARAKDVVGAASDAIEAGRCVCIYPEGTITKDPLLWPMVPKSGAVRIALATRCTVVPVAQWGANFVMPGHKPGFPRFIPRKTMRVLAGDPVNLEEFYGVELTKGVLDAASDRIMDAITALVEVLRGERAPETRWNVRTGQREPRHAREG